MSQKRATSFRTNVWRSVLGRPHQETTHIRLKAALTRGLVLPVLLLALLAAAPVAAEVLSNHSGAICKNMNAADVAKVEHSSRGIQSVAVSPPGLRLETWIICPLTRNTGNRNGAMVYVEIWHYGSQTTRCYAESLDYDSYNVLAWTSGSWTGEGFHEFALNLAGYGKSGPWSHYVVSCGIPADSTGRVASINLIEDPVTQ